MDDPLVNTDGSIDWPDVTERTYNTLRQAGIMAAAILGLVAGADFADLAAINVPLLVQAGVAAGMTAGLGLVTLADNVVRQWLAARKKRSQQA